MTAHGWAIRRAMVLMAAVALVCGGCLSIEEPSPSAAITPPAPLASMTPRDPTEMVVAVPADPQGFLPPATDETTQLLVSLLYDPLYRLDEHLRPQPDLASDLPQVSADGLTWNLSLKAAKFSNGAPVLGADVAFSLQLAQAVACPFGRDLCGMVSNNLASVSSTGPRSLTIVLQQPFGPFLTGVLAQLPVLSQAVIRTATQRVAAGAAPIDKGLPNSQVATITDATNQDACLTDTPPFGCKLSDYTPTLEKLLGDAGVLLPPRERFTGTTGDIDVEAYAGALLDRVSALDQILNGSGTEQYAAALPLLDPVANPMGSGPYALQSYVPGATLKLRANKDQAGGAPPIPRITLRILRDPAQAATALLTGDADWILHVDAAQYAALSSAKGIKAAYRAVDTERTIVFNVRAGRIYSDPAARRAFALCLDRSALALQAAGGDAIVALTPTAAGSWAMSAGPSKARDTAGAIALLQGAGWTRGADGIFAKAGKRLSSSIAVRPSRTDLLAFAGGAAQQLSQCGIELQVQELDLTGDLLLSQLQWPNDFDTVLLARSLGADPDPDVQPFESSHATSAQNPADANPGGYVSTQADSLIEQARRATDVQTRSGLYGQLQALLATDVPEWPIWYDTAASALSTQVRTPRGPVDPSVDRFWWDVEEWSLGGS